MSKKIFKKYQLDAKKNIDKMTVFQNELDEFASNISKKIISGGKILTCGNGGSSCDAQHFAAELLIRLRSNINRKSIPAIFLGMDIATITACANDYGYSKVFSRSLEGVGNENDVLICYSTSGKSKNIINVLKAAKKKKIFTISFLGRGGGLAKNLSDKSIVISSNDIMRIQESHLFLSHYLAEQIEKKLLYKKF